jgi:hypothetical protein
VIQRRPFVAWAVVGVLLGLTIASPVLGLVTIPVALAAIVLISRRADEPDEALGILAGAGLAFIAVGWLLPGVVAIAVGVGAHALVARLAARG